jgi:hypothetical protein
MQIIEEALKVMRDFQPSRDELGYLESYNTAVELTGKLRKEHPDNTELLKLEYALVDFVRCYFDLCRYKERAVTYKREALEKELEIINFINSNVGNGFDSENKKS